MSDAIITPPKPVTDREKLDRLLDFVWRRPTMCLPAVSVTSLQTFLAGVSMWDSCYGAGEINVLLDQISKHGFKKCRRKQSNTRSHILALNRCGGDEEMAFYLWFEWYRSWVEENA